MTLSRKNVLLLAVLLGAVTTFMAYLVLTRQQADAQVTLAELAIEVTGRRAPDHPKRYLTIHFSYRFRGDGLDEAKARRAIDLSHQKYCSVMHSLNSDIAITYDLDLG